MDKEIIKEIATAMAKARTRVFDNEDIRGYEAIDRATDAVVEVVKRHGLQWPKLQWDKIEAEVNAEDDE